MLYVVLVGVVFALFGYRAVRANGYGYLQFLRGTAYRGKPYVYRLPFAGCFLPPSLIFFAEAEAPPYRVIPHTRKLSWGWASLQG